MARWKKNINLEGRLKNARFLGEMTKFRVAPPIVVLRCLKRCLDDFTGFNIDVACCLLESCGRYLYRMKHTKQRLSNLLDTMMRIRQAKNLDERSVALINSAFYMVSPPQTTSSKQKRKVVPPLEAYLRHLLIDRLANDDKTISFVSKQLQRLPWSDPTKECGALVCKYMLKACRKGRYEAVGAVASVAAALKRAKPEISTRLIDGVLEELQWTMEHPNFRDQQRTIACARLLGELHVASLVPASLIIEQLYHFVNFGHEIPLALHDASEKQLSAAAAVAAAAVEGSADQQDVASSATATIMSPSGITQTIKEDEEMDSEALASSSTPNKDDGADVAATSEQQRPAVVAVSTHSKYDPRVPSFIDPPSSVFRIKLVCVLLSTVAPAIITSSNKAKLDQFMTSFQRYLFTKSVIPTEVEFLLLDTFDELDSFWKKMELAEGNRASGGGGGGSTKQKGGGNKADTKAAAAAAVTIVGFKRYVSWIDAHNATVAAEDSDYQLEARAKARLLAQGGVRVPEMATSAAEEEMDVILNDELEDSVVNSVYDDESIDSKSFMSESDDDSGDDDSSATDSNDDSSVEDASDDESEGSEDETGEEDDDMYDDEEEEIDEAAAQEAYLRQMQDEAFERELRKLTMDALEKGKISARTGTGGKVADAMPAASQIISKKLVEGHGGGGNFGGEDHPFSSTTTLGGDAGISFKVLKRGHRGRVEAKSIIVPNDTNLAKVATKQDDAAARERDMLKARVLQYEVESAEQQYSGGNVYMDQTKLQVIRNRPLSMEDIDRNFGSSSGDSHPFARRTMSSSLRDNDRPRTSYSYGGRGGGGGGGGGRS
uniref:MIF4G domain-containing protein n=1 Tax=Ditylum brightwellii TaxID=49249 RepID=A0A7S4UWP3_9STRA